MVCLAQVHLSNNYLASESVIVSEQLFDPSLPGAMLSEKLELLLQEKSRFIGPRQSRVLRAQYENHSYIDGLSSGMSECIISRLECTSLLEIPHKSYCSTDPSVPTLCFPYSKTMPYTIYTAYLMSRVSEFILSNGDRLIHVFIRKFSTISTCSIVLDCSLKSNDGDETF